MKQTKFIILFVLIMFIANGIRKLIKNHKR